MARLSLDTATRAGSRPTSAPGVAPATAAPRVVLPAWPVAALFALYPLWFVLGVLDVILIVVAVPMVLHLLHAPGMRVPRGFALWLLFLLWAGCSLIEL